MARGSGYKDKLLEEVESLSEERIRALADFAAYLREREEWEATAEILGNEEMTQDIRRSRRAWADGRKDEFIPLSELKAKLHVGGRPQPRGGQKPREVHAGAEGPDYPSTGDCQVQSP